MKENPNWKKQIMELASFYSNDCPSEGNLDMEIERWEMKWAAELPSDPQKTLQQYDSIFFPKIHTLLRIVCTLPVTSCSGIFRPTYNPQWVQKE